MEVHVQSNDCRLCVDCHGGSGAPVLLLHGLGSSLLAWRGLVPALAARHQVFALDLRGHGHSTAARWTWDSAIADIDAVLAQFSITEAQLVGHSLGGILAVVYASHRPRVAGIINIDGRTSSDLTLFRGLDASWTREKLTAVRLVQEREAARQLSHEQVDAFVTVARSRAREAGETGEMTCEAIFRCLEQLPNGRYRLRPGPRVMSSLLDALDEINLMELYPRLTCPCLIVRGTDAPQAPPDLLWIAELERAHTLGETAELKRLSRSNPALRLALVKSTHARLLREPRVAGLIGAFLDRRPLNEGDDNDQKLDL